MNETMTTTEQSAREWVSVPREPTPAMLDEAWGICGTELSTMQPNPDKVHAAATAYDTLLAVAPKRQFEESMLHRVASLYQEVTGVGLPFSQSDESVMLAALEASFRKRQEELRELRRRDFFVRELIQRLS